MTALLLAALVTVAPPQEPALIDHEFSLVRDVEELPDGTLLVADWIEAAVFRWDPADGSVRALTREGGGPAEIRLPGALYTGTGDTTYLVDLGNRRWATLLPDQGVVATRSLTGPGSPGGVGPRGEIYLAIPPWASRVPGDSVVLVVEGNDAELARLKGATPKPQGAPSRQIGIPITAFAPQDDWELGPDGSLWVVRSDPYRIEVRAADGGWTQGPTRTVENLPVTETDQRAFLEAFLTQSPMSGRGEGGGLGQASPSLLDEVPRMLRTEAFADEHPPFVAGSAILDPQGEELWVQRSLPAGEPERWERFDRSGAFLGQVTGPVGGRLVEVGRTRLYWVFTDELGLQRLGTRDR